MCRQDRLFPQVLSNELRWVRGAGEVVGYDFDVPTATCGTRWLRGEAYCSAVIVQGVAVS